MLTVIEGRILGCLLEKERTTPEQYPLTLNALVLACNQSTARDPVMVIEPHDAEAAIAALKVQGLARLVHPSHGRSVTRYRQVLDEHFGWSPQQAALMSVLLLRGPQTTAELKTRAERQFEFRSLDEVDAVMRDLSTGDDALVAHLERAAGQKEPRWQQLFADEAEQAPRVSTHVPTGGVADRLAELEARVARLETALADLLE